MPAGPIDIKIHVDVKPMLLGLAEIVFYVALMPGWTYA